MGNSLSENYMDWLKGAEEALQVVDILFEHEKYRFAIFNLQQAAEITSKAILMRVS
jgi:HEPN domain-containing protein